MTFGQARVDAERKLIEESRTASSIAGGGGGTEAQRNWATQWAQQIFKQVNDLESAGKDVSSTLKDAADSARDVLRAASGGEEVRAPGGPNPTVGSIMSSVEGLATQGLARGSDIPRLDTSFTDLAVRIRDVILGVIPNFQNFSNALAAATKSITGSTGNQINLPPTLGPGQIQFGAGSPGQASPTGTGTPAQPTFGLTTGPVGGTPPSGGTGVVSVGGQTVEFNQGGTSTNDLTQAIKDLNDRLQNAFSDKFSSAVSDAVAEGVSSSLSGGGPVQIAVGVDPGTGDLLAKVVSDTFVKALQ
jgi:hypothetical protein